MKLPLCGNNAVGTSKQVLLCQDLVSHATVECPPNNVLSLLWPCQPCTAVRNAHLFKLQSAKLFLQWPGSVDPFSPPA